MINFLLFTSERKNGRIQLEIPSCNPFWPYDFSVPIFPNPVKTREL